MEPDNHSPGISDERPHAISRTAQEINPTLLIGDSAPPCTCFRLRIEGIKKLSSESFPTEVSPERKVTLGLRWLVNYSRLRNEKTMTDRLANEIIDAANGTGASVKKREDTHKMAEANKAYSHYRW